MFDFSGGVYNPHWGGDGAMIIHGGGHAATYDNSVVVLDFNDFTFKRLSNPSIAFQDLQNDPSFNTTYCEYGDGQPGSAHTYDTLAILPPDAGGGPQGSLMRIASYAVHVKMSLNTGYCHRFDLSQGTWERFSTNGYESALDPGGASAYDSLRKRFWWFGTPYNVDRARYLDAVGRFQDEIFYQQGGVEYAGGLHFDPDCIVLRYHPQRDLLIVTGTYQGSLVVAYLDAVDPVDGWRIADIQGIPVRPGWSHPFDFVAEINRFVMLAPADNEAVYEIEVPSNLATPWPVTRRAFGDGKTIPTAYVAGKRWSYAPSIKAFIWLASPEDEVYGYRPFGVSPP
jgi:hypothetical protein